MINKHTPGPWHRNIPPARKYPTVWAGRNTHVAAIVPGAPWGSGNGATMSDEELEANSNLIAAAPDLLAACQAHAEWSQKERLGPIYPPGITRDQGGEAIWSAWWNEQLDLCDTAQTLTASAIAQATGESLSDQSHPDLCDGLKVGGA